MVHGSRCFIAQKVVDFGDLRISCWLLQYQLPRGLPSALCSSRRELRWKGRSTNRLPGIRYRVKEMNSNS